MNPRDRFTEPDDGVERTALRLFKGTFWLIVVLLAAMWGFGLWTGVQVVQAITGD